MHPTSRLALLVAAAGCASTGTGTPATGTPATTTTPASTSTPASSAAASSGTTGAATVARSVDLKTKDGRLMVAGVIIHQSSDEFRGTEVGGAAEKLWAALPAVYDQLGLPLNGVDTEKRAVAAVNVRAQVQLAKVRMSQYVDCGGAGSIGGRAADSYALTMNVATQVIPITATRSEVATLVQTYGRPASSSGQPVHCTSTGNLEQKIADLAEARLRQ